jgi:hypothetical protein
MSQISPWYIFFIVVVINNDLGLFNPVQVIESSIILRNNILLIPSLRKILRYSLERSCGHIKILQELSWKYKKFLERKTWVFNGHEDSVKNRVLQLVIWMPGVPLQQDVSSYLAERGCRALDEGIRVCEDVIEETS